MKRTSGFPTIDACATGKNILRLRLENKLSVSELQSYLGLDSPQAIYYWQQGKYLPRVDHLYALSQLFHVTINDILVPEDVSSCPSEPGLVKEDLSS